MSPASAAEAAAGSGEAVPGGRPAIAHPTLFGVLVAVGLLSVLQIVETVVVGRAATGFVGINALVVVPFLAAAALVTTIRAQERRWAAGMGTVLAVTLALLLIEPFGNTVYRAERWLQGTVVWVDGTADTEGPSGLLLRLAVSVPPMLWYAWFGPAGAIAPRLRRVGLAVAVVAGLAVSLVGAALVDPLADGSSSRFGLLEPQYQIGSYRSLAVVGLGNIRSTYDHLGYGWATALWCAGWLVLLVAAGVAFVSLVRQRRLRWALAVGLPVVASLVVGAVAPAYYSPLDQWVLGSNLAVMTGSAGVGVLAFALFGWRASARSPRRA